MPSGNLYQVSDLENESLNDSEESSPDNAMDELRLYRTEVFWRELYFWLEEKGYRLRPRYHPDWVASWKKGDNWLRSEDAQVEMVCHVLFPVN